MFAEILFLSALAVLPSDRLAMADRLFNRGKIAEAQAEYKVLKDEPTIAADELLYRFAECDRALGKNAESRKQYAELFNRHPASRHAARARFMYAMGAEGEERRRELKLLDTDRIPVDIRAAALYYLGTENGDVDALERCVKLEPKGKYATYATLRRGSLLASAKTPQDRRKGIELLLGVAFEGSGDLAEEALYLAAVQSYRDKKYGEAGSLFRRYLKSYPTRERAAEVKTMSVWCDYLSGRYADAAAACGDGATDDFSYLRAACALATGDEARALELFRKYLTDFPTGRYRDDAELPLARLEFKLAEKSGDSAHILESAKRGLGLSGEAADRLRLAWAYERAGRTEEAIAEYVKTAETARGTDAAAEALFRKAMLDAREERWNAAEVALAEALDSGKCGIRTAEAFYWRGMAAIRIGHETEGLGFLKKALEIGLSLDASREARLALADADLRAGRTAEAKAAYERLVDEGACERMSAQRILAVGKLLDRTRGRLCAQALVKSDAPEWRQAGYALLGSLEEADGALSAAIAAYRKCLSEKANVTDAALAALHLGQLESRAGEFAKAEETLKKAVALNVTDVAARGQAYLALARNSEAKKDFHTACAYATVVTSLFDDAKLVAEAKKILDAHPEALDE